MRDEFRPEQSELISITLGRFSDGRFIVKAVDFLSHSLKLRLSTGTEETPDAILNRRLASDLTLLCGKYSDRRQVISLPDYTLDLGALMVRGITILVHRVVDGSRQFVVRLRQATGYALTILNLSRTTGSELSFEAPEAGARVGRTGQDDTLLMQMLEKLYMPLCDLNTYINDRLESGQRLDGPALDRSLTALKTRMELFQFAFENVIRSQNGGRAALPHRQTVLE
ncbi:MAG: hypothetical protein AAF334_00635 [Pseudomonadota bacterium]